MSNPILLKSVQIFPALKGEHNSELAYSKMDEVQYQTSIYRASEDIPAGVAITDSRWVIKLDNRTAYTAEQGRVTAETSRASAETSRASAETSRGTAEGTRASNETARGTAESGRATAEQGRVSAESSRATAESGRATAESGRVSAESGRVSAETARASAETTRAAFYEGFSSELAANKNLYETAMSALDPGAEMGAARISGVKGKTFDLLGSRIEELENDIRFPAKNELANSNFADGMTGYTAAYSTAEVITGGVRLTGNGTDTAISLRGYIPIISAGNKFYIKIRAKSVHAASRLSIRAYDSVEAEAYILSPTPQAEYKNSAVFTYTASATNKLVEFRTMYADSSTQNGKALEIYDLIVINLTSAFGADNEPTASSMDTILSVFTNSWFDGTVNLALASRAYLLEVNNRRQIIEKTGYGVVSGLGVTAQGTPNMTVAVATGVYYMSDGKRFAPVANAALAVTAADATKSRIDIVYVNSSGAIAYLAGTAADTPAAPATPTGGLLLAEISVAANVTTIQTANIADRRKNLWNEAEIIATLVAAVTGMVRYSKAVTGLATVRLSITAPAGGLAANALFATLATSYRPLYNSPFPLRNGTTGAIVNAYLGSNGELRNVDALTAGVTYTGTYTFLAA